MPIHIMEELEIEVNNILEQEKGKNIPMKETYAKCITYLSNKYDEEYGANYYYIVQDICSRKVS